MSLTKFQALVARESMADVHPTVGDHAGGPYSDHGAIVKKIGTYLGEDSVRVYCCGQLLTFNLSELNPSRSLLELIERGTYNEETMTWQATIDGQRFTEPLSY